VGYVNKEENCVSNINTTLHGGFQLEPKESQNNTDGIESAKKVITI
jgi:hypothetical protein